LKKINKSVPPNDLTQFFNLNPSASWKSFRDSNNSHDYTAVKQLIFTDQGELCAYCEISLRKIPLHKKSIEHYHSKSDKSNPNLNWALDWNNVIGVCFGGSDSKEKYPLPSNLSCDSYKAHLESINKLPKQCEGYVLNPLDLIATPCLFDFDKATGKLKVNDEACLVYIPQNNNYETVVELVGKTIDIFNLNCDRLIQERRLIFHDYQRKIKAAKKANNIQIHDQLADYWFSNKWPSFFSIRRILLARPAEQYLNNSQYDG